MRPIHKRFVLLALTLTFIGCADVGEPGPASVFANLPVVKVYFLSDDSPAAQWAHYGNLRPFDDSEVFAEDGQEDPAFKALIVESIQVRFPELIVHDLTAAEVDADPSAIDLLFAASDLPLLAWREEVAPAPGEIGVRLAIVNVASFRYLATPAPTVEEMADLMAEVAAGQIDELMAE